MLYDSNGEYYMDSNQIEQLKCIKVNYYKKGYIIIGFLNLYL